MPASEVGFCADGDAYRMTASRSGTPGEFRLLEVWALEVERAGVELHLRFETR